MKKFEIINNLEKINNKGRFDELLSFIGSLFGGYWFWNMTLINKLKFLFYVLVGVLAGIAFFTLLVRMFIK
ncbi:MAG: hypothetical protein WCO55_02005 [Candidatus Falkowbacteria bacterium]